MSGLPLLVTMWITSCFGAILLTAVAQTYPTCHNATHVILSKASAKHRYTTKNLGSVTLHLLDINDEGVILGYDTKGVFLWSPPYNKTSKAFLPKILKRIDGGGLNKKNDVCGFIFNEEQSLSFTSFMYIGGKFKTFTHPNDTSNSTQLSDINDKLQAVGTYFCNYPSTCSFLLDIPSRKVTPIGPTGGLGFSVSAIANDGTTTGQVQCNNYSQPIGFVHKAGNLSYFYVASPSIPDNTLVTGLSNNGYIVGSFSTLSRPSFILPSRNFSGGYVFPLSQSSIQGINNRGEVIGGSYGATGVHSFIGTPDHKA